MNKLALLTVTHRSFDERAGVPHDMPRWVTWTATPLPTPWAVRWEWARTWLMSRRVRKLSDVERAHDVMNTLRRALVKYHDYHVALAEHYEIFLPTVPQDVYHFTDYAAAPAGVTPGISIPRVPARSFT